MEQWPQIKEIFHTALEREPQERSAFLTAVCRGDAGLRAEVERLLTAHQQAASFIEPPPARRSFSGQVVGRYQIGRLLGAGGMGEVYVARDVELGRDVAVKVATAGDAAAHAQIRREAQHASQLNHPNICTIHEVGWHDGQPFIVMEHVVGDLLSNLVRPDGLPIEQVQRYGVQIADAVAHAHRHGVIHSDLKTANIVITPDNRAKVLDFGLARRFTNESLQQLSESRTSMAAEGVMAGTLSCMAPELLRGEPASKRSDIWAFGVLLYEMVTGQQPFQGATGFELSGAILHAAPAPLPDRAPPSLQAVSSRCLAKDPSERYAQAGDIRSALEAIRPERARPKIASWRAALAIAALVAVVGLAAAWYWVLRSGAAQPVAIGASGRPAIAVMAFEHIGRGGNDDSWLSKGVPSMLLTGLAQTRGLEIVSAQRLHDAMRESGAQSLELLDRGQVPEVARRAGAGAVVVGSIFRAGAEIRIDAQLEDLATGRVLAAETVHGTDLFALVDELSARIRNGMGMTGGSEIRRIADVSSGSLEAYRLYSLGVEAGANMRMADARKLLEQAVTLDPTFAEAYLELAFNDGSYSFTHKEYLVKAQEHAGRLSERHRLLLQAAIAIEGRKFVDAGRTLDDLMARFPDVDRAYSVASVLHRPGFGGLKNAEKFLAITRAGVKALPFSPMARNNYGYALLMSGRSREAVTEFQAYTRIAPREPNPFDGLGDAYFQIGDADKALEWYGRAIAIDPAFPHDSRAQALAVLGRYDEAVLEAPLQSPYMRAQILSRVGRYREAEQVIADELKQTTAVPNVARTSGLHLASALMAIELKDYPRALRQGREAEKLLPALGADRRRATSVLVAMLSGIAESRSGKRDRAMAHLAAQQRSYQPANPAENLWYSVLEGELGLAAGDLERAARAFSAGEPPPRDKVNLDTLQTSVLPGNQTLLRDGAARVARARGDLRGAIQIYQRLLVYEPGQLWIPMFEPRYVLEIARLRDRAGDKDAAKREYERFLDLWKHADAGLSELAEARAALVRIGA